ncbi:MAG: hypothetical protein AAF191_13925 [Verrucomicrobiota bacterium]
MRDLHGRHGAYLTLLTKWPEFDLVDRLDELLTFFEQSALIQKHGFRLPHWQQPGACSFVTFRLADSCSEDSSR